MQSHWCYHTKRQEYVRIQLQLSQQGLNPQHDHTGYLLYYCPQLQLKHKRPHFTIRKNDGGQRYNDNYWYCFPNLNRSNQQNLNQWKIWTWVVDGWLYLPRNEVYAWQPSKDVWWCTADVLKSTYNLRYYVELKCGHHPLLIAMAMWSQGWCGFSIKRIWVLKQLKNVLLLTKYMSILSMLHFHT